MLQCLAKNISIQLKLKKYLTVGLLGWVIEKSQVFTFKCTTIYTYSSDKLGISKSSVGNIVKKQKNQSGEPKIDNRGSPIKFNAKDRRNIIRSCLREPFKSSSILSRDFSIFSKNRISPQMVRKILTDAGIKS